MIAAAMALAAPAAHAACGGVKHGGPLTDAGTGPAPLAVGDSVMLGAFDELQREGFEVDVRGCRQMSEGLQVLKRYSRAGSLPPVVVVALGYNWTITTGDIRRALRIAGRDRILGLVTPRGANASAREAIHAAGARWPARVRVLDWARKSSGKAWTWDGMHLTAAGARGFARLLREAHGWTVGETPAPSQPPQGGPGGGVVAP